MSKKIKDKDDWKEKVLEELTRLVKMKIGFHKLCCIRGTAPPFFEVVFVLEIEEDHDCETIKVLAKIDRMTDDRIVVQIPGIQNEFELVDPECLEKTTQCIINYILTIAENKQKEITKEVIELTGKVERLKKYLQIMKTKSATS